MVAGRLPQRQSPSFLFCLFGPQAEHTSPACHVVGFTRSNDSASSLRAKALDQFVNTGHLHDGAGVSDPSKVPQFSEMFSYIAEADGDHEAYDRLETEVYPISLSLLYPAAS